MNNKKIWDGFIREGFGQKNEKIMLRMQSLPK